MKKIIIRMVAIVLIVMMLSSSFIGCGKGNSDDDNVITVLAAEIATKAGQAQDTVVTEALEEKFGVEFKFITEPSILEVGPSLGRYASRNAVPDIVMCQTDYLSMYRNFLLDLGDYLDEMPNLAKYTNETVVARQIKQTDGSFFVAPYIYEEKTWVAYMIRTDWLENLGYEEGWVPNTFSEFDEVMRAFANDDPNMDGASTTEFGFYPMSPDTWLRHYAMHFGVSPDTYIKDGEVVYGPLQPEYKEAIMYLNDLYKDGVIDPEFITGTQETFQERISSGKIGFTRAYFNRIEDCINWSRIGDPDAQWKIILPPLNEETGKRYEQYYTDRVGITGLSVSKKVKGTKREKILAMLDYLYSEEGILLTSYGVEGITYDMVDGEPVFKDIITNNPEMKEAKTVRSHFGIEHGGGFSMVQNPDSFFYMDEAMDGLELYRANQEMYDNMVIAPPGTLVFAWDDDEEDAVADWTYIQEKEMAGTYEFIRGRKDFSQWDTFLAELKSYGLEKCMEKINEAYQIRMS